MAARNLIVVQPARRDDGRGRTPVGGTLARALRRETRELYALRSVRGRSKAISLPIVNEAAPSGPGLDFRHARPSEEKPRSRLVVRIRVGERVPGVAGKRLASARRPSEQS
jgi:hypothetical protein